MEKELLKKALKELFESGELKISVCKESDIYAGTEKITGVSVEIDHKSVAFFDVQEDSYGF